jgi:hypothetical protein
VAVLVGAALSSVPAGPAGQPVGPAWTGARVVPRTDLVQAMARQKAEGYDLAVTANGVRLQVGVVLDIVRSAASADPDRTPLRIQHEDYYHAFMEVLGLEPERAPIFIRTAFEHGEDQLIDYRRERVVARIERGGEPKYAMNVKAGWPERPGAPSSYTYEDTTSNPRLRVTHDQVNTYRILDLGDMIVYDDIQGIRGRATSGALGVLFRVIGDGRAVQSRLVFSMDGLQVTRTRARKFVSVTQTVTVHADGRTVKGVPPDRPDLEVLAGRLERPFEVDYVQLDRDPVPPRN